MNVDDISYDQELLLMGTNCARQKWQCTAQQKRTLCYLNWQLQPSAVAVSINNPYTNLIIIYKLHLTSATHSTAQTDKRCIVFGRKGIESNAWHIKTIHNCVCAWRQRGHTSRVRHWHPDMHATHTHRDKSWIGGQFVGNLPIGPVRHVTVSVVRVRVCGGGASPCLCGIL